MPDFLRSADLLKARLIEVERDGRGAPGGANRADAEVGELDDLLLADKQEYKLMIRVNKRSYELSAAVLTMTTTPH